MTRRVTIERPTILQIIPRLDTGGAELSAIEITEAIVRAGGRALLATEGGRLLPRITEAGGEIVHFPAATKNPVRILANALALARLVAAERIDLLHARSRAPAWSALIAARRTGRPFVTTYHGAYAESGAVKRLYNSVMARSDVVIANSQFTADLVRTRYDTPVDRIRVIHRGVDLAAFDPEAVAPDRVSALRRAWDVADGRPIILQAARLTSWKGQRITIEAIGRLRATGGLGEAVLVLAGDAQGRDAYAGELRDLAARLGVADAVRFPGHVSDVTAAFLAAHVAVIASIEPEAFGRTATEAQAMGCPVIATDIGAPRETVRPLEVGSRDGTGWLVPPGDPSALADRIAAALALSSAARSTVGRSARTNVEARFTLARMKGATLEVYDQLLGTGLADRFLAATAPQSPKDA